MGYASRMILVRLLLMVLLLAGCRRSEPVPPPRREMTPLPGVERPLPPLTQLTGRYQGVAGAAASRLCIIAGKRTARFGLVIGGTNAVSCSGSGTLSRRRGGLRLAMSGDSPCAWLAGIEGRSLVFPAVVPAGCRYYCGAGASLAGARLTQVGHGAADALRAKDLVGDPLCADQ